MASRSVQKSAPRADFIEVYDQALDRPTCQAILDRFTRSGAAQPGRSGGGVRPSMKDSWDITISANPEWADVEETLNNALVGGLKRYVRRYPHAVLGPFAMQVPDGAGGQRLVEPADLLKDDALLTRLTLSVLRPGRINLQRYIADQGGYPHWHSEHFPLPDSTESLHRTLLWTIYLNDGFSEGETEFLYQSRKIKPRTGSLLIAPSAFTHTHRGNRPRGGDKYIATSWALFMSAERLYPRGLPR